MPWDVKKDARCPASKPYGVVGGASGDRLAGCHPTQDAARKQQAALYAAEDRESDPGWADQMVSPRPRIVLP
jgi:hypothetical protein